jgi:hypothetical protein
MQCLERFNGRRTVEGLPDGTVHEGDDQREGGNFVIDMNSFL